MLRKYPQFSYAYAIIFSFELIFTANNLTDFQYFTKPLISISLMLFLLFTFKKYSRFGSKILIGLFFSLLGDISLMFTDVHEMYFMLGLAAFLITHIFYIAAFYLDCANGPALKQQYMWTVFLILGGVCLASYYFLHPYLGSMQLPVLVYSFVITLMAITAALRYKKTTSTSFMLVLIGAVLFMISDSVLAYNKFVAPVKMGQLIIMATYMLAQFFITMGTVERKYIRKH